jgi:Fe-S-cluster containining protein
LEEIYSLIPDFDCKNCHKCCGPIVWFKPEEILIREYMLKNNIKYVVWSTEEFKKSDMRCPYIKNDKCVIYPVRPIVCRLQGVVSDLPCLSNKTECLSKEEHKKIKNEFNKLLDETSGNEVFYGTRKL